MAEVILGSVVDSITGSVASLISQEIGLACGVKGELEKLQSTVSSIGALLREADRRQVVSEDMKDWLGKLRDVVYDADDLLDDFSSQALLRRSVMGGDKLILNEVRTFFSSSNQIIYASKMAHRVKDIRERIEAITNDRIRFKIEGNTSSTIGSLVENRVRPETYSFESKPYVIGRDKDKKKVIEFLLNPHFEENVSVLPIVAMGGMGKTTLARDIFNDESVKEYFQLKLWVCVSTTFTVEDILGKIVQECKPDEQLVNHMNELRKTLGAGVDGKRFLLILDDVWNENRDKWLELQGFLGNGEKGSKILVTTRSRRVAQTMTTTIHELSGLPEEESLSLLMRMAMKKEHEWRGKDLEIIAKEILKKCSGVPLAITTIGRLLLFTRNKEEDWLKVKNIDLARSGQDEGDIMPSLKLSYDFLPSNLKRCFAYCSLFPKDYKLCPSELIHLWMAQGFIESTGDRRTLEEIGQDYFMELVSRSFFQDFEEDTFGDIRCCKMHDLMHDLAQSVSGNECITIEYSRVREIPKGARHASIVDIGDRELKGFEMKRKIRSLLFFAWQGRCIEIPHLDFSRFRNLRALRLQNLDVEVLPSSIGKLKHLRSLDLSFSRGLRSLPNSVSRICNLETLVLRECLNLERLPRGITKLVNLRELNVPAFGKLKHMPRGIGNLTNLQNLPVFAVGEKGNSNAARLNELSKLGGLRGRMLISNLEILGSISNEVDASFSLERLGIRNLELSWELTNKYRGNDEEVSERCRPNPDITGLEIRGYGDAILPSWVSQLHKLVSIRIGSCNKCRYIPPLDHLPSLKSISLSDMGNLEWIELSENGMSQSSFFPCLESLKLFSLSKFRGWKRRRDNVDGNDEQEEEEEEEEILNEGSLSMLPNFSIKVQLTMEDCPRFSCFHGQGHRLAVSRMENLQLLQEVVPYATHPFTPQLPTVASNPSRMMTSVSISSISPSALTSLSIHDIQDEENFPAELFQSLVSLQSLEISDCPRLKSLPVKMLLQYLTALQKMEISRCKELDLCIDDYEDDVNDEGMHNLQLHGHGKLNKLVIKGIEKTVSLPGWIQYLPNLKVLFVTSWGGLKSLPGRLILRNVETLLLHHCPELDFKGESEHQEDIPNLQFCGPIKLKCLSFFHNEKMTTLPWWIQHVTNLEFFTISKCNNLKILPEWLPQLTSLKYLNIRDCGKELKKRCKRKSGKDWPKISHIPNVIVHP